MAGNRANAQYEQGFWRNRVMTLSWARLEPYALVILVLVRRSPSKRVVSP